MNFKGTSIFLFLLLWVSCLHAQRLVRYDLHVNDTLVNYTGKIRPAVAINGTIPAPTLYFTEGDTAEIHVHNHMHHETSIHWHGLLLPNEQDGVPYLTTSPIRSHSTHIYKFPIRQSGTYWYHSHTMLQEQSGMYGAFIIRKRDESTENTEVLLLSDWSDENPHQIERSLHHATDWYMIKKGSTQNYAQAAKEGYLKTRFNNELKRMHAMDVSDVYYELFTVNGQPESSKNYKPGAQVRLRVINGSSSTYFWLTYPGSKITVIASDGSDVEPVEVDRLIVGVSETYDVLVSVPEDGTAAPFLATAEDRTGNAVFWLGSGARQELRLLPGLKYFEGMKMMNDMMTLGGKMHDMGMNMSLQQMDMNEVMYPEITGTTMNHSTGEHLHAPVRPVTLNYSMLKSPVPTVLPEGQIQTYHFELTGNMNRYVWTVNHKTISESDKILIRKGENIRMILTNNSMMRHPMHLHGHFFRVLNGKGDYAPLKNVIDIMPMETDTIEFHASESYGDWFFHCHILYHMMSGMGRIFTYENSPPNPQIPDPVKALRKVYHDDRRFYPAAEVSLESNGSDGEVALSNTRWMLQAEWHVGIKESSGYETESHFGRFLDNNQFFYAYAGWDFRYRSHDTEEENMLGQTSSSDERSVACFGVAYTLPWFIVADVRIDHTGYLRFQVSREDVPLTSRLRLRGMFNSDREYSAGLKYILTKYLAVSTHYDSDMGMGAGISITY